MFSMKTLAFQYRNFKQRSTGNDFITQARGPEADRQTNRQLLVDGTNRRQTCQDSRRPQSHNTVLAAQAALQAIRRNRSGHRCSPRDCSTWPADHTPLVRRNHPTRPAAEGGLDNNLSQDPVGPQRNLSCNETSDGRPQDGNAAPAPINYPTPERGLPTARSSDGRRS